MSVIGSFARRYSAGSSSWKHFRLAAPHPLKAELLHLMSAQRSLSRKQKGSNARDKARLALARVHRRVSNLRADWQWKAARDRVRRFDLITIEDLSVIGMSKLWGRKITDLGLADFSRRLEHQTRKAGTMLVRYPRFSRSAGICDAVSNRWTPGRVRLAE